MQGDIWTDPKSHARYITFANSLTKDSEHNEASQMVLQLITDGDCFLCGYHLKG